MPTLTGLHLMIVIDVLTRVSLLLTVGLLLTPLAKRNAALRHAILVAALAGACIMPAAMLTMQVLPVSRWHLSLHGRTGLDDSFEAALAGSRPPSETHQPSNFNYPAQTIVATARSKGQLRTEYDASVRTGEWYLGSRAWSGLNVPDWRGIVGVLFWALLFGAIVKVTGLGLSLVRLRQVVARAHPVTGDHVLSALALIRGQIPMRYMPRLLESAQVSAPIAAGVIGNYVLLPTGWAETLRPGDALAVLFHESAHLVRRDHRVVILQEVLASVLWFHPLVHLFNRMLSRVREEVCDNYAIAMVDRASYCETLLHLAVGKPGVSPRGATSMWSGRWSLEDRVRGILDVQRPTRTRISRVARSLTATTSLAICALVVMPQLTGASPNDPTTTVADADALLRANAGSVTNEMTKRIIKHFPVNGNKMLHLENLAGRVEIVSGNGSSIEVVAIARVGGLSRKEVQRIIEDVRWIEAPAKDGESRWGLTFPSEGYPTIRYPVAGETKTEFDTVRHLDREIRLSNQRGKSIPSMEFDLRVSLPTGVRLRIDNAVGSIESSSIASPLSLSTRHGVIRLDDVRGPIDATSKFGDVLLSRLNADAVVRTERGGIELSRIAQVRVTVSTHSGSCRVVLPIEAGFRLQYSGSRPIDILGGGVARFTSHTEDQRIELLSRGTGGPSITLTSETGRTSIEPGP